MEALKQSILQRIEAFPGHTSFYFKDLTGGESFSYNYEEPMGAASVIKLTVMAELFRQIEAGLVSRDQKLIHLESACERPAAFPTEEVRKLMR